MSTAELLLLAACLGAGPHHDERPADRSLDTRVQRVVLVTRSVGTASRIIGPPMASHAWLLFYEPGDREGELVCCDWVYVGGDAESCAIGQQAGCWRFHFVRWNDGWVNCNVESPQFSVTNLASEDDLDLPRPLGLPLQPPIPPAP